MAGFNLFDVGSIASGPCGCCGGVPLTFCGSCGIPAEDLTVSWFGGPGDGSTTLTYTSGWNSACTNGLLYQLLCNVGAGNVVEFRVVYFIAGACPTGTQQYCSTLGSAPLRLVETGLTCGSSFLLTCNVTALSCPNLFTGLGYTGFSVHL